MPNRSTVGSAAPSRIAGGLLLCASLAAVAAACDETHVEQHPGAGAAGGGSGGSLGSAGGGGGGSAGTGGSAELGDASVDATPDADAPLVLEKCVLSTIEDLCRHSECPTLEQARFHLRSLDPQLTAIVQRRCSSGAGTPRISVSANYQSWTQTYVYDAETRRLVSMRVTDDVGSCDEPQSLNDDNFGSLGGFYGEKSPDCDFVAPPECGWPVDLRLLDAGIPNETAPADAGDAGVDRRNNECLLAL